MNEKGAGGIAEVLVVLLASILITGSIVLIFTNTMRDVGDGYGSDLRSVTMSSTYDIDSDGRLNGLFLVAKSPTDNVLYYRVANPVTDYGEFNSNLDDNDDGDARTNAQEVVFIDVSPSGNPSALDLYYHGRGATLKAAPSTATPSTWTGMNVVYDPIQQKYNSGGNTNVTTIRFDPWDAAR